MSEAHPPLPPFTEETAIQKIRAAEDVWNTRDPERVSLAYTVDSQWRNRSEIFQGRPKIVEFLTRKWNRELDYRLIKELMGLHGESYRGPVCVRIPRRFGKLVPRLRQRELGIRRERPDASATRQHQ
jgi:nuclear transport factor 2 (NTF2) superfamily protein